MGFTWLMGLKGTVGMGLAVADDEDAVGGRQRLMVGGDGGVRSYFVLDN